eukprot:5869862-Alexandrium_andersonii.AAC.1
MKAGTISALSDPVAEQPVRGPTPSRRSLRRAPGRRRHTCGISWRQVFFPLAPAGPSVKKLPPTAP